MKTRITVGCGLLLTLGTAMAGTWMYGQGKTDAARSEVVVASLTPQQVDAGDDCDVEATAASSTDYMAPACRSDT